MGDYHCMMADTHSTHPSGTLDTSSSISWVSLHHSCSDRLLDSSVGTRSKITQYSKESCSYCDMFGYCRTDRYPLDMRLHKSKHSGSGNELECCIWCRIQWLRLQHWSRSSWLLEAIRWLGQGRSLQGSYLLWWLGRFIRVLLAGIHWSR
jgi:hypothetical protein